MFEYVLKDGILVSKGQKTQECDFGVKGEKIAAAGKAMPAVDLGGTSFVYPALINTHDHLNGNYRPPIGPPPGTFYLTWLPWDNDLKASDMFKERQNLDQADRYALSGYKCLFSGVGTVNDHFPQSMNREFLPTLPIRAILEYGIDHEATSYDLKWGDGLEVEHARAVEKGWPFITHLCEGFDEEAMHSVENLEKKKLLDNHCLFVHCISLSDEGIRKIAKAGASVSWCGFSNMFMFNVTSKIRKLIKTGVNVTIGTDSSATGSANLLAEMKYDRDLYRRLYGEDLSAQTMFEMVTANAAKAFWMDDRIGTLENGKLADILVLKAAEDDPYENLLACGMEDIELLTLAGTPLYGESRFIELFGKSGLPEGYTEITVGGRRMFVKGDPAGLYREVRRKVGLKKVLDFLPFEPEE